MGKLPIPWVPSCLCDISPLGSLPLHVFPTWNCNRKKLSLPNLFLFSYWKKGDLQKYKALQTKSISRNRSGWVCFLVAKSLGSNPKGLYAAEPDSGFYLFCVLGQLPKPGKSAIIYTVPAQHMDPFQTEVLTSCCWSWLNYSVTHFPGCGPSRFIILPTLRWLHFCI